FWLWRRGERPIHSTLLALGLDRFYELWINFGVLLIGALLLAAFPVAGIVNWLGAILALASIPLTLFLLGWFILKRRDRVFAWLTQLTYRWRHHPRLQHIDTHWQRLGCDAEHVVSGGKHVLFRAFVLSLLGWVGLTAELWLLLSVFDLTMDFPAFLTIMLSMRLAFLLPLPGGIGTLEASLFWAFQYLSLPTAAAIGLIALIRLRDALVLLVGLGCLGVMQARK
ncbi:MAG: lysylphosphatidylglycerol synthase domain-containing protein, partial [Methylomonas sp.]